jgi:hypothetical protein
MTDFRETRALLIDLRAKHGAETPIGRVCSNLLEVTENHSKTEDPEQRHQLMTSIERGEDAAQHDSQSVALSRGARA